MKLLKEYWFLIVFIFGLGSGYAIINAKLNAIDEKLDAKEFFNIREKDSLKQIIKDNEIKRLKREVNPPPEINLRPDSLK